MCIRDSLTFEAPDAATPQDAPTTTVTPDGPVGPTCTGSKRPPSRGDAGTAPSIEPFSLAVTTFDMGIGETPLGLDLDRVCTVDPASSSCVTDLDITAFNTNVVDKAEGVDNASYGLLKFLGQQYPTLSAQSIDGYVRSGVFGFLIDVIDYNGQPNDSSVSVSFRPTLGVEPRPGDAGAADAGDAGPPPPLNDGQDRWIINEEYSLADRIGNGIFLDVNAYVRDGVLVATYPEAVLPVSKDTSDNILPIKLRDFTIVAKLTKTPKGWALSEGVMAGGWRTEDAFPAIRNFAFSGDGTERLCEQGQGVYDTVFRSTFCSGRDLPARLTAPRSSPCASVSAGFGFAAVQAINSETSKFRKPRPQICPPAACPGEDAGVAQVDASDGSTDAGSD